MKSVKREIKGELRSPLPLPEFADNSSPSKVTSRQQKTKPDIIQVKTERITSPISPPTSPSKLFPTSEYGDANFASIDRTIDGGKDVLRTTLTKTATAGVDLEMERDEILMDGDDGQGQPIDESTSTMAAAHSMTIKERRTLRQAARRARRKSLSKSIEPAIPLGSIQIQSTQPKLGKVSYQLAKQYLTDPLVEEIVEHRHITLGWQHAANMASIIQRLMSVTIGQYRSQIEGVPIAIGDIHVIKPLYIIGDHNCMNVDVDVQIIVLKVQPGEPVPGEGIKEIECQANSIMENKCAVGTAYGNLMMTCTPAPTNLKAPGTFKARFMGVQFKNTACQIKCAPLGHRKFNNQ